MFRTKTGILSLVFLVPCFHLGDSWGANYDQARQYESSRLGGVQHKKPGGFNGDPYSIGRQYNRPGANSYETAGRNDYGEVDNSYGQPPQSNGYGGGFDENDREIVIPNSNGYGRPSIDDQEDDVPAKPAVKCRPFYSLNCERFCPAGNSLAPDGCRTCVCCPVLKCKGDCSHGVVTHGGCATCNCKTPPSHVLSNCPRKWCTKECKLGFVKDRNGCPLCKCNRRQYKTKWHSKFQ